MFQKEVQNRKNNKINKIMGHLMLDEIKLKNGIAYNCNSNEVTDFFPEHMYTNCQQYEMEIRQLVLSGMDD